jgi:3-carboxy-cis,cis-muconate cycloisomerase
MGSALSLARADAVERSVAYKKHLRDVLTSDSTMTDHLDANNIAELFEPTACQGASQVLIGRLLASPETK